MFSIGCLDELPFGSGMAKPRRSSEPMVHKHVIFKDPLEEVRYFSSVDLPGADSVKIYQSNQVTIKDGSLIYQAARKISPASLATLCYIRIPHLAEPNEVRGYDEYGKCHSS
jgi:hypothetical protein